MEKKAATRKTRVRKGLAGLTDKPKTKELNLYANGDKDHRYAGFGNAETRAYSIAGLELLGLVNMNGQTAKATRKSRARADLRELFGPTMVKYWIDHDWIAPNGDKFKLTVNGLNNISASFTGAARTYQTTPELVEKMLSFIRTGKGLKGHKGQKVTVAH